MADAGRIAELERTIEAQRRTIDALMDAVEERDTASTPTSFAVWKQHAALTDVVDRKTRRLREALAEIGHLHAAVTMKSAELEAAARAQSAIVEALDANICILHDGGPVEATSAYWGAQVHQNAEIQAAIRSIRDGDPGDAIVLSSPCPGPEGGLFQVRVCRLPQHEGGRVMVAYLDITGLLEAERALATKSEEAAMLALVARHMDSAVVISDANGHVEWTNECFTQQTGYTFEEAAGRRVVDLLYSPDRAQAQHDRVMERLLNALPFSGEVTTTGKDGRPFPTEVDIRPLLDDDGGVRRIVAIRRDITARKEAEARLAQAERLESVGQLAAGVADEINTPMQYIGDNLTFLRQALEISAPVLAALEGNELDSAVAKEFIHERRFRFIAERVPCAIAQALEGVAAVTSIVKAMRAFSHAGGDGERAPTDINACVEMALTFSRSEWKYVARVETRLAPDLPLVIADGGSINQVVLNLVVNAAHAIGEANQGDALGTITITTRHDPDAGAIVLEVADTGAGIPAAIIGRIFDPFFTTKEVGKGTGQGLAIARTIIVKRHGGTIDVSTTPGHGSVFTACLPTAGASEVAGGDTS